MKFSIKDFSSKCYQIRRKLRILSCQTFKIELSAKIFDNFETFTILAKGFHLTCLTVFGMRLGIICSKLIVRGAILIL